MIYPEASGINSNLVRPDVISSKSKYVNENLVSNVSYELNYNNSVLEQSHELSSMYIVNLTGKKIKVTYRDNTFVVINPAKRKLGQNELYIEIRRRIHLDELDNLKRNLEEKYLDSGLSYMFKESEKYEYINNSLHSGYVTLVTKYSLTTVANLKDFFYHGETDLLFTDGEDPKPVYHPKSVYAHLIAPKKDISDAYGSSVDLFNITSIVVYGKNYPRPYLYLATAKGVQHIAVKKETDCEELFVVVTRPVIYDPDSSIEEPAKPEFEQITYSFDEIGEELNLYKFKDDAVAVYKRLKNPKDFLAVKELEQTIAKQLAETKLTEAVVKNDTVQKEAVLTQEQFRMESHSSYNKGVNETIKTIGAVAGLALAVAGVVKLIKG